MLTVTLKRSCPSSPDRVVGDRVDDARVDVGGRAQLERDAPVAHVGGEPAEVVLAVDHLDVVDDAHPVAEALGAAPLHRLPDRRQPERLTGVDGGVEVLALHVLERIEVAGRRVAGLGARDVEAHDARITPAHRQLGDLQAAGGRPHGRADGVDREVGARRADPEALQDGVEHLVQGQPGLDVELGGEAHLGVHEAVGGEVLGALGGHADDGVAVLHHADGVRERLQVEHEVVALGAAVEPRAEVVDVGGREAGVAVLRRQLDDGGGAQATVEVVVEDDLRRPLDADRVDHGAGLIERRPAAAGRASGRSGMVGSRCNQFQLGYRAEAEMQCRE